MEHIFKILIFLSIIFLFLNLHYPNLFSNLTESFVNSIDFQKKTIYLIWRNKIRSSGTTYGFGDKLRGAIFLYQYCKKNKICLKIDGTDDMCGDYLVNVISPDYLDIKDKHIMLFPINATNEQIEETITKELEKNNQIYIFSNSIPGELTSDDKEFAKAICEPQDILIKEIEDKLKDLPENFGVQHFRFNDKAFNEDIKPDNDLFKKYFQMLKSSFKPTDVLFTNSNNFKNYAIEKLGIQIVSCNGKPCPVQHIGESTQKESVKNSFVEFFILTRAKYIKSYSCYNWPSGFVYWPAKIYDIPFENVYIEDNK